MFDKKWEFLSQDMVLGSIADEILRIRGITDSAQFQNPNLKDLHDPFLMNDMDNAVLRIKKALDNQQKICVYGDYDADGLTSAAILVRYLKSLNAEVICFIPDRFDNGYGLNIKSLGMIAAQNVDLVITTDCGINSTTEAEFLLEKGIDLIITDHHMSIGELPSASAVICCTRKDNKYPYINLSGAGVAYKLACALNSKFGNEKIDDNLLVLASLGTVTDIVPLDGENRIIVSRGLAIMKTGVNYGVNAILDNAAVNIENISTSTLGFVIGPRINAAGRMGNADYALELLLSNDYTRAGELAIILSKLNNNRKKEQDDIFAMVLQDIKQHPDINEFPVIVAAGENYNKGIIGIVASKISDIFKKPSIILSISDGMAEGSGRSIGGLSLIDALEYCSSLLLSYGGHKNAAGLSLKEENITKFKGLLREFAVKNGYDGSDGNKIKIDCMISPDKLNFPEIENISKLEPFGMDNPKPVLSMENAILKDYRIIGSTKKHISMGFGHGNYYFKAVCFNSAAYEPLLAIGEKYNIAFNAEINEFRSNRSIQLQIKDMNFPDSNELMLDLLIVRLLVHMVKCEKSRNMQVSLSIISQNLYEMGMPDAAERILCWNGLLDINRGNIGDVYNELRGINANVIYDIRDSATGLTLEKICLSIEILIELGLLKVYSAGMYTYKVFERPKKIKKKLDDSLLYRMFNLAEGRNG